jgi:hypothetical protein
MGKEQQLTHLYTCSQIDALALKEFLEDNDIACFLRNDMYSGNLAGFGAALPGSDTRVFVTKKDFMRAKVLLEEYLDAIRNNNQNSE